MSTQEDPDVADEDGGADFNGNPRGVIGERDGGFFHLFVALEVHVIVNFLEADLELDAFAAHVGFAPEDFHPTQVWRGDRVEGPHDGFAIVERHAANLEESGKKGLSPSRATAVGPGNEMLGVAGALFSKEDFLITGFQPTIPGHGIGEPGGADGLERVILRNVDAFEPSRSSTKRPRECQGDQR